MNAIKTDGMRVGGFAGWMMAAIRGRASIGSQRAERVMKVVETLSLGGQRQLTLVSCSGQKFLVGGGADRIDAIVPVGCESLKQQDLSASDLVQ